MSKLTACIDLDKCDDLDFEIGDSVYNCTKDEILGWLKDRHSQREDAERWRKVKEIAKRNDLDYYPCRDCPVSDNCDSADSLCGQAGSIVDALEGGKDE